MPASSSTKDEKRLGSAIVIAFDRLVYYEVFRYVNNAIARETEIKAWRREKKVALIEATNSFWDGLAADWGKPVSMRFIKADSSSLRSSE